MKWHHEKTDEKQGCYTFKKKTLENETKIFRVDYGEDGIRISCLIEDDLKQSVRIKDGKVEKEKSYVLMGRGTNFKTEIDLIGNAKNYFDGFPDPEIYNILKVYFGE